MRLDENRELFLQSIKEASVYFDMHREFIEKDYWLVSILKNIVMQNHGYVFKGGTSLSKCYHLINRFSEDIDISYSDDYESIGIADKNRKFKGIITAISGAGLNITNKEQLRRSAYFNRFECGYDSFFSDRITGKKVIVELAAQTPSFPINTLNMQSLIGEFLDSIGKQDLTEKYDLRPFGINVQSLERTLVDKIFAICDYYLSEKYSKHSRHLYDIYKILKVVELNTNLIGLFKTVRSYRAKIAICLSAKSDIFLHEILENIIKNDSFKDDYEKVTYVLLYEPISYKECKESLIKLQVFLEQNNL